MKNIEFSVQQTEELEVTKLTWTIIPTWPTGLGLVSLKVTILNKLSQTLLAYQTLGNTRHWAYALACILWYDDQSSG